MAESQKEQSEVVGLPKNGSFLGKRSNNEAGEILAESQKERSEVSCDVMFEK